VIDDQWISASAIFMFAPRFPGSHVPKSYYVTPFVLKIRRNSGNFAAFTASRWAPPMRLLPFEVDDQRFDLLRQLVRIARRRTGRRERSFNASSPCSLLLVTIENFVAVLREIPNSRQTSVTRCPSLFPNLALMSIHSCLHLYAALAEKERSLISQRTREALKAARNGQLLRCGISCAV
jgi:hypothetical protein